MRMGVFGAGPIGTTFGTILAETCNDVAIYDIDATWIEQLQAGRLPFYERGLDELLRRNQRGGRLRFVTQPEPAILDADLIFVAVDSPQAPDGTTDSANVQRACQTIARLATRPFIIAVRTTVPIGTTHRLQDQLRREAMVSISVSYNPVFAQKGRLVDDFLRPDRVLIGVEDLHTRRLIADIYEPYLRTNKPILFMDPVSAEVAKLTVNAILASRISFMNEISRLCDAVGADVDMIRRGVGTDSRLGAAFLFAGTGFGGRRFPKNIRELIKAGQEANLPMDILRTTDRTNEEQKHLIAHKVRERLGQDLTGRIISVWGLAFKAGTSDVSESPALVVVRDLLGSGARVRVYDPEAMEEARVVLGEAVEYSADPYEACRGADALIVAVEWNQFRRPNLTRLKQLLKRPIVFDGRNLFSPDQMQKMGFDLVGLGRRSRGQEAS